MTWHCAGYRAVRAADLLSGWNFSLRPSRPTSSSAEAATAIAAGSLELIPPAPKGPVRLAASASSLPRRAMNRARFVADPITPQ